MKKIDLMLKLLFIVALAPISYSQGPVGSYPGSNDCAGSDAFPIFVGDGYEDATPSTSANQWYTFVAPGDGELEITNCPYGTPNTKRIYTEGTCDGAFVEAVQTWTGPCNLTHLMEEGEEVKVMFMNNWNAWYTFDINFTNPDCPDITGLSAFSSEWDEGTIGWFPGAGETEWILTYGPEGFDPAIEGTTITVSDDPFAVIDGLTELTCYDVYVTSDCGGGETGYPVGPVTFCTPAICPVPLNPTETGITNTETLLGWDPGADEEVWDVEWGPEGFLLGTGSLINDIDETDTLVDGLTPDMCYDWYVRAVCAVDLGDGLEIVNSLWVGPQEWCTNRNCLTPTDLNVIDAPGLSATLGWTANNDPVETEWNIQYGEPGFVLGEGTTVTNVPTNPFTLTGLEPSTEYCFYVQAVCGEGDDSLSTWSEVACFETSVYCDAPTGLFASADDFTSATLDWDLDASGKWVVTWGEDGFDPETEGTEETVEIFPNLGLTGLTPGQVYCYYVRAVCGEEDGDSSSVMTGPFCWTQPPLCEAPFDVEMINITNTAAHVNYTLLDESGTVDIEWGAPCFDPFAGDEIGSVTGTEDDPYYITGLEHSTPYEVYVRATCVVDGSDEISSIVGPILFGTDIANDNPCDAEELIMDGEVLFRHNFDATTLPGETALLPPTAGCGDFDGWCSGDGVDRTVWFKFDAPASGQATVTTFDTSLCRTNSYTEIAIYSTGDCGILGNFTLEAANSLAPGADEPPYGSMVTACGLTPGETYYVMVNPIGFIEPNVYFEIALTSVDEVSAGLGLSPTICEGSEYDLFTAIAGYSSEEGTWYNPVVAPGNEYSNEVVFPDVPGGVDEVSFDFFYVIQGGCDADTVMTEITITEGVNAGEDGFYTACNSYDIVLSDHIVGEYDGGGIWEYTGVDPDVALAGGLFSPLGMTPGVYEFLYTVSNEFCPTDSVTVTVTLTECTGLEEEEFGTLEVFPNPVVDILTVQNLEIAGTAVIEVLDVEGRIILSEQVSDVYGNYTIDMTNIESGVYFVKVTADNTVQKVRVVRQ